MKLRPVISTTPSMLCEHTITSSLNKSDPHTVSDLAASGPCNLSHHISVTKKLRPKGLGAEHERAGRYASWFCKGLLYTIRGAGWRPCCILACNDIFNARLAAASSAGRIVELTTGPLGTSSSLVQRKEADQPCTHRTGAVDGSMYRGPPSSRPVNKGTSTMQGLI